MTDFGRFDAIILGAGATGLWTASSLIQVGARVLVIHAPHEHGYSSTRNQGWLHSGGLYAVYKAQIVARDCAAGAQRIRAYAVRHDPSLIADAEFSYVFDSPQQADVAVDLCRGMDIDARRDKTQPELQSLFGHSVCSVSVPDAFIDTSRLLRILGAQLISAGLNVVTVRSLRDVRLRFDTDQWIISGSEFSASTPSAVIAAGTLIPEFLAVADSMSERADHLVFDVTETTVLGVPHLDLPAAVVCTNGGPHVIPYRSAQYSGMTICVPFDNQATEASSIHRPPDSAACERVLANIRAFMPGLGAAVDGGRWKFWYCCQKLIPAQAENRPDWRHNVFAPVAPGLYVAYAGKFTTAPVLAEHIAQRLDAGWSGNAYSLGQGSVDIADQPFLSERAGHLSFRKP